MRVESWMRREAHNEVCFLVIEDNQQARSLMKGALNYAQDGEFTAAIKRYLPIDNTAPKEIALRAQLLPFRRIQEDPLFQEKKKSSPLQVADFIAYVCKRLVMSDTAYQRFAAPFKDVIWKGLI
jgi:hypothetical protein